MVVELNENMPKPAIIILVFFAGVFCFFIAIPNGWLAATPVADPEFYKKKALFYFSIGYVLIIASFVWGAIEFIIRVKKRNRQKRSGDIT